MASLEVVTVDVVMFIDGKKINMYSVKTRIAMFLVKVARMFLDIQTDIEVRQ